MQRWQSSSQFPVQPEVGRGLAQHDSQISVVLTKATSAHRAAQDGPCVQSKPDFCSTNPKRQPPSKTRIITTSGNASATLCENAGSRASQYALKPACDVPTVTVTGPRFLVHLMCPPFFGLGL